MADGLIAATAFEHDCTVVTRNVRDFTDLGLTVFNPWELLVPPSSPTVKNILKLAERDRYKAFGASQCLYFLNARLKRSFFGQIDWAAKQVGSLILRVKDIEQRNAPARIECDQKRHRYPAPYRSAQSAPNNDKRMTGVFFQLLFVSSSFSRIWKMV